MWDIKEAKSKFSGQTIRPEKNNNLSRKPEPKTGSKNRIPGFGNNWVADNLDFTIWIVNGMLRHSLAALEGE